MSETILKIDGKDYPLPIEDVLAELTGSESIMLEDYLGGWDRFDMSGGATRSLIVLVWLARHHAGEEVEITDIEAMKGLVFGNTVDVEEVDALPPVLAAEAASESSPATSETNGVPTSEPLTV